MYDIIKMCDAPVNILLWIVLIYNTIKIIFVLHLAMTDAVKVIKIK